MSGSIERLWRLIPRHQVVPMAMLVVGVYAIADPTHRTTGYGGVLSVPIVHPAPGTRRPDPLLEAQRREVRASRGRVLYAPGHAPAATPNAPAAPKTASRSRCTMRVGQRRPERMLPAS